MVFYNGNAIKKMSHNGAKVKEWWHNGVRVFSAIPDTATILSVDDSVAYNNVYYSWTLKATGKLDGNWIADKVADIDCTDYKYCRVRAYTRDIDCIPSGGVQDNLYAYLGFGSDVKKNATLIARKTAGTVMGTYGEGATWGKWADVEIDISNLTDKHDLTCIGSNSSGFGNGYLYIHVSKVVLHN